MVQAAFEFNLPGKLGDALAGPPPARRSSARPVQQAGGAAAPRGAQPGHAAPPEDLDAVGFEIGWDHAHHRVTPPLCHLHSPNPVHQGWLAGRATFCKRTLAASAAVRQWLALRLQAWLHGQVFEGVQVTPHFLARIDAVQCPVSRQLLTLSAGRDSDATVTRLNPQAAYAAGNLVVLSQRVADIHHRGHASAAAETLGADESARLAVLSSFATPLPHAQAALLPLRVLPPNRARVINPVQALQVMLTLQFLHAGYARRLLGLAVLMPGSEVRQLFQIFMHTLLARRLSAGQDASAAAARQAMEDSWADVLVNRRWQRLATRLSAADCERLLQRASQRGLVVGGSRWVSSDAATDGWALTGCDETGNKPGAALGGEPGAELRAELGATPHAGLASQATADSGLTSPGIARSLGSQNAAN